MNFKIDTELAKFIEKEQFAAFALPARLEKSLKGLVDSESNSTVLNLLENIFRRAGHFVVIDSDFGDDAFYGEGRRVRAMGEMRKNVLKIPFEEGRTNLLRNFICNVADDPLLEEPRGTLIFRLNEYDFIQEIAPSLGAAFFIRNYSVNYRKTQLRQIREAASTDGIAMVISDRMPLRSIHCFGNVSVLIRASEMAEKLIKGDRKDHKWDKSI